MAKITEPAINEIRKKLNRGYRNFGGIIIDGNLLFSNITIKGKQELNFSEATFGGNLSFSRAVFEGDLFLIKTTIMGSLDFSTKKGPKRIFVDPQMAQFIHYAAPTVPLIVV